MANAGEIRYTVSVETQASIDAAQQANKALDATERQMLETDAASKQLNTTLTKLAKSIGAVVTVAAIYGEMKKAVVLTKEFNATISNLGALTGLAGDDLKKLENAARRIGATTSLSGTQAAEGMRLIGSQVPALLASTDALAGVTKAAAVLAEAANTDLPSAAQAIAGAINQFGIAAEETDMIINALAAGAKNGASSVEQTAAAMAVAGTTAKGAGVSFEEFNALVQTLGQGQIFAAEAGTALRNVLLRLESSVDTNLRPSVVGVGAALRNMEKEVARGTSTYEKFGIVNKTAADTLLQNIDYYEKTVVAVTATNEAYEQQARNSDNLKTDVAALNSAYEDLQITLGQKLDPTLRGFAQTLTSLLLALGDSEDGVSGFEKVLSNLETAATAVAAVMAARIATSLAVTTKGFYTNTIAAGAAARANVATAQSAVVLAAQNLITAQAAERAAVGLQTHAAAAKALAVADAQATAAVNALTVAQTRLNGIMTLGARAAAALRTGMAFLGGPLGVALLAATAFFTLRDSADEVASSLSDMNEPLDETVKRLQDMSELAREAELRRLSSEADELAKAAQAMGQKIALALNDQLMARFDVLGQSAADTVPAINAVKDAANDMRRGAEVDFNAAAAVVRELGDQHSKLRDELLESLHQMEQASSAATNMADRHSELSSALSQTAAEAVATAGAVDELTDSLRTGSNAAAEYTQKAGRALEDAKDKSAVGKLTRDIRDNAEAWETATKEQLDAAFAVAFATDAYTSQQGALRKATGARKGMTKADREAKQAADQARKGAEDNAKALERLSEQIYQTGLNSKELAQRQAELMLNEYATPEQIEAVRALSGALFDLNKLEKDRAAFGEDVGGKIRGDVPVLQGGGFDDGTARYEAEKVAEERRYAEQLERLEEAERLKLEVAGGYDLMREQLYQEHSDRMAEIDRVRLDMQLTQWADGFGSMSQGLQAFATEFGKESKGMFAVAKAAAIAQAVIQTYQAATGAYAAMASIPYVGPALGIAAAAAAVAGGMAKVSAIRSQNMGGGRQYGGPVSAGKYYRVNEGGMPEIFKGSDGNQYLMPNQKGEVVSNREATSGGGGVVVNLNEDASRAGQVNQSAGTDEQTIIDIFVSNIMSDGRAADALQSKYGIQTQGR